MESKIRCSINGGGERCGAYGSCFVWKKMPGSCFLCPCIVWYLFIFLFYFHLLTAHARTMLVLFGSAFLQWECSGYWGGFIRWLQKLWLAVENTAVAGWECWGNERRKGLIDLYRCVSDSVFTDVVWWEMSRWQERYGMLGNQLSWTGWRNLYAEDGVYHVACAADIIPSCD